MKKLALAGLKLLTALIVGTIYTAVIATLVTAMTYLTVVEFPRMYQMHVREMVGTATVILFEKAPNSKQNYGGTGFFVKAKSGKTYVLTNKHVCEGSENDIMYGKTKPSGNWKAFKILERAKGTDLCLLEVNQGNKKEGLTVAKEFSYYEKLNVVGHPALMEKNQSSGEIFAQRPVYVAGGSLIRTQKQLNKCLSEEENVAYSYLQNKPFKRGDKLEMFDYGRCLSYIDSNISNIYVEGGSSGSSVTNSKGEVVGIVYGVDGTKNRNWAIIVKLQDIKALLNKY